MQGKIQYNDLSDSLKRKMESEANVSYYSNCVMLISDTDRVYIGSDLFDKESDMLLVFKNGIMLSQGVDYIISSDSTYFSRTSEEVWRIDPDYPVFFSMIIFKAGGLNDEIMSGRMIKKGTIPYTAIDGNFFKSLVKDLDLENMKQETSRYYKVAAKTDYYYNIVDNEKPLKAGLSFKVQIDDESGMPLPCKLHYNGTEGEIRNSFGNPLHVNPHVPYHVCFDGDNFICLGGADATGNATADQILIGYSATTENGVIQGRMPSYNEADKYLAINGTYTIAKGYHSGTEKIIQNVKTKAAETITPSNTDKTISKDQYLTGDQVIKGDTKLSPENILKGVTIFGIAGTCIPEAGGTATPEQVLEGFTASIDERGQIDGTMKNNGAVNETIGYNEHYTIPEGYHNGHGSVLSSIPTIDNMSVLPKSTDQVVGTGKYIKTGITVKGDANLSPENILTGKSIFNVDGIAIEASGDATKEQVLYGVTASNANGAITGTMPNHGAVAGHNNHDTAYTIPAGYHNGLGKVTCQDPVLGAKSYTPGVSDQIIAKDQYLTGDQTIKGDPNLKSSNILHGVTIFGITGAAQLGGNPTSDNLLEGYSVTTTDGLLEGTMRNNGAIDETLGINGTYIIPQGYHDGTGTVKQSIATLAAKSYIPSTADQVIPASRYLSGAQTIKGDVNLLSKNIVDGVSIFGVTGSCIPGSGNATNEALLEGYSAATALGRVVGTMDNRGAVNETIGINGTYVIPAGYHNGKGTVKQSLATRAASTLTPTTTDITIAGNQFLSGAQTIKGDAKLVAGNIKKGVSIFGVEGSCIQASGSAGAGSLLYGATASNVSGAITGTMPNNGAVNITLGINGNYTVPAGYHNGSGTVKQSLTTRAAATITPGTTNQTIAAGQYLSGAQTIKGDANLVAGNVRKGVSIFGVTGTAVQASGSAAAWQVLYNVTASNVSGAITGTMPNNGAVAATLPANGTYKVPAGYHNGSGTVKQSLTTKGAATINPSTSNQTIAAGQYLSGVQTIKGDANLVAGNIKKGVSIFGVTGTCNIPSGNAGAAQVLTGYSASNVNGAITGTMPNNGAVAATLGINGTYKVPAGYHNGSGTVKQSLATRGAATITPKTTNQTIAAGQYLSGVQTIMGDSKLVSGNIKKGTSIFGVVGQLEGCIVSKQVCDLDSSGGIRNNSVKFYIGSNIQPLCIIARKEGSNQSEDFNSGVCLMFRDDKYITDPGLAQLRTDFTYTTRVWMENGTPSRRNWYMNASYNTSSGGNYIEVTIADGGWYQTNDINVVLISYTK